jgi:IclR family transcriptional regulator, acetate operon repressor
MDSTNDRYRVQSLGRGLDLLNHIAERGREGGRLSDLARELCLSKAACYAMLQTLIAHGFVTDRGKGTARRYRLGMTLARLGEQMIDSIALPEVAVPVLRDLTAELSLTSRVAVFDEGHAVVVGRVDAPGAIRFDAALGRRELPHCTAVGKALLASLQPKEAKEILARTGMPRRTPQTITSMTALMKELSRIGRCGYAIDDEEDTEGVQCIGTCVFDRSGKAAGAISVTGLKQRSRDGDLGGIAATVIRHADRISQELGGPTVAEVWARPVRRKLSPG